MLRFTLSLSPLALLVTVACGSAKDPADASPAKKSAELAFPEELPVKLSDAGYDVDTRVFTPRFELWSDGEHKERRVHLPEGSVIDDSNVDEWRLPAGTRLYKDFVVDGKKIETRMMWRGEGKWLVGAYVWNVEGTEATLADPAGVQNVNGTQHDVPDTTSCQLCHASSAPVDDGFRSLGFSGIQLAYEADADAALTVETLIAEGKLEHTPAHAQLPGDALDQRVIGWVHANCGACHSDAGMMQYDPMRLRLSFGSLATKESTPFWQTAVNQEPAFPPTEGWSKLVDPGSPATSLIYARATHRLDAEGLQMPPMGSEVVPEEAGAALSEWITRIAH